MADLKNILSLYFVGIGGIGMSAIARYFHQQGKTVTGFDKTKTPLTKDLESEGIEISYKDDPGLIPKGIQLVVYTPAIPRDNFILNFFRERGFEILKRSEMLGLITADTKNVCVSGTHGKTTISTMIAHVLRDSGVGANAFLGGISVNYNTNFWSNKNNLCVVEADEYDRSFLQLNPDIAIISSMDADHLDIYGTGDAVEEAFVAFSKKIKSGGTLVQKHGLPLPTPSRGIQKLSYHLTDQNADVYTKNLRIQSGNYVFDVDGIDEKLTDVRLNVGGRHNVENALAAITACRKLGLNAAQILPALNNFRGVRRRFEYHVMGEGPVYIDDYAHHPKELNALITSARELFPQRRMVVIFQPHLFSRTRDFAGGFAESLDKADEVILLPIYPARELPIENITSNTILEKMKGKKNRILDKTEVTDWLKAEHMDDLLLITAGAGDIDTLVKPIAEILKAK
jgi:UDP-N-acetylmuramate--alanine ligase